MKTKLNSTMRTKKRYLIFSSGDNYAIEKIILDGIGVLGWAKAKPVFLENFKKSQNVGSILAVDRKYLNDVRAAFAIADTDIKIIRVSGTLNRLFKK